MADSEYPTYIEDESGVILAFKAITAEVEHPARSISAPLETGEQSFDNKVIDPIILRISGYIQNSDSTALSNLERMQESRDFKFYEVMVGGKYYSNLILENLKDSKEPDKPDLVRIDLIYKEVILIQTSMSKPKNPAHSPTSSTGRVS